MRIRNRVFVPVVLFAALIAVAGCKKKAPLPPPQAAPPPAAAAPTAQLTATPTVISVGDQVQLAWRTTDATQVSIDGLGDVPTTGVKTVTPDDVDHLSPGCARRGWLGRCDGQRDRECAAGRGCADEHR